MSSSFGLAPPGVDDGVRVAAQQPAADEQCDLAARPAARVVRELFVPRGHRRDVREPVGPRPEPLERRAALIGRELAPEQLPVHLRVESGQQGCDEAGVGLEQRDRLVGDGLDTGQEAGAVEPREQVGDADVELGRGHDPVLG